MKTYRDNGAVGALLDEYEKAIDELIEIIQPISSDLLHKVIDAETKDDDCRSIQTILRHVLKAGFNYAVSIHRHLGTNMEYRKPDLLHSSSDYITALREMFEFNESLFSENPNIQLEEHNLAKKMKVVWGQSYDVEQIMEHAIVHILRHRRQIERFLIKA